jgi:hypothetical protein
MNYMTKFPLAYCDKCGREIYDRSELHEFDCVEFDGNHRRVVTENLCDGCVPRCAYRDCYNAQVSGSEFEYCVDHEIVSCLEVLENISRTKILDDIDAEEWCMANEMLERMLVLKGAM